MSRKLYAKLSWTGIQKNKQFYVPYLIAGIVMVMAYYILTYLAGSPVIQSIKGGATVTVLFGYGALATAIFSVPFLFYTNSALIRRRKKELGLYNILGMNKRNLFVVLLWEAAITYGITAIGGIMIAAALSKMVELGILNLMGEEINYCVYVDWQAVLHTLVVFAAIFLLILLNMMRQIRDNNPIALLHSEAEGEQVPKNRWFLALVSLLLILAGYAMTVMLPDPSVYTGDFFRSGFIIAALVAGGTFLLFLCATVLLCRLLQSSKRYYYKTSHFITVSSMAFRMNRSGLSLASICVLIMGIVSLLSFTTAFHVGTKDAMQSHYPLDFGINIPVPAEDIAYK